MKILIFDNCNPVEGYIPQQTKIRYTAVGFGEDGSELYRGDGKNIQAALFDMLKYVPRSERAFEISFEMEKEAVVPREEW